jgi:Spy/CpxP family protein refolding chaperone
MKKIAFALLLSLVTACSDGVSPTPEPVLDESTTVALDEAAALGYSSSLTSDPGSRLLGDLHRLPRELALTSAQQTEIQTLLSRFNEATKADRELLAAIGRQMLEAIKAGKSREEIRAIIARGDAARERLRAAEAALRAAIEGVLTAEQKAWLAKRDDDRRCKVIPLTAEQRTQISALVADFQKVNAPDFAIIRDAFEKARTAHKNGATRAEIAAILEAARPAMERIRAAQAKLNEAILAVLTPEQRTSRCFHFSPPTGPGAGSRG